MCKWAYLVFLSVYSVYYGCIKASFWNFVNGDSAKWKLDICNRFEIAGISSFGRATCLGKGKPLNWKPGVEVHIVVKFCFKLRSGNSFSDHIIKLHRALSVPCITSELYKKYNIVSTSTMIQVQIHRPMRLVVI